MRYRKERPLCRKEIEKMMKEKGYSLKQMLEIPLNRFSEAMRIQLRKMAEEQGIA